MTHSVESFAEHCIGLLKNSGSSGSRGSRSDNPLNERNFAGTTPAAVREPVRSEWFYGARSSGSDKIEQSQNLNWPRTTRTTRTANFERGRAPTAIGDFPCEWHVILEELKGSIPIEGFTAERWQAVVDDAKSFLAWWAEAAHQLGWTGLDLFGVHPTAPAARLDVMGLIPLLQGATVVALTEVAATIRRSSNATLTYRRSDQTGAVCIIQVKS